MNLALSLNDFYISELPKNDIPTRKCRVMIIDVCVKETNPEEVVGDIDIQFLVLSPSYAEPFIHEKQYINFPIDDGVVMAFEELEEPVGVDDFRELVGAVFEGKITYGAYKNEIYVDLILEKMLIPPLTIEN